MEEGEEQVQGLEPEHRAVRLPADAAGGLFRQLAGGQGLGDGGEQHAPPHGGAVQYHGQEPHGGGQKELCT